MKKLAVIILLILPLFAGSVKAQRGLAGQYTAALYFGTVDGFTFKSSEKEYAFSAGLTVSKFLANKNRLIYGLNYLQKDLSYRDKVVKRAQMTAEFGYGLRLVADRANNVVLWGNMIAAAGYETTN